MSLTFGSGKGSSVITGIILETKRFSFPHNPHPHHQECPIRLGKFSRMRNYSTSKTVTAELGVGRARLACSSINTCAAIWRAETRSQQPALLETAAETTAGGSTGKEDLKADRRVRHTKRLVCKNGHSLVEPPSRVFYTISVSACLFVGERFFQKVYGRPLPSTSPFTLFAR